jgi:hypothetical protein
MDIKARDLVVSPCTRKEVSSFIEENHYSHNINGVKSNYCFQVTYNEELVGAVLYGQMSTTAWKKFGDTEKEVLELRRLVLLDKCLRNSESRVIGFTLRWLKKNAPCVKTVVSYADPNHGHEGVIYKASNFKLVGMSGADKAFRDVETGRTYHSRALRTKYKGEYKPFVKRLRDRLDKGLLEPIVLMPKYCYTYQLTKETH